MSIFFPRRWSLSWLLVLALAPSIALPVDEPSRRWKDRTGKFEIDAVLTDRTSDAVQLRKADGKTITVPIETLCEADKQYVLRLVTSDSDVDPENPFAGGEMIDADSDALSTEGPPPDAMWLPTFNAAELPSRGPEIQIGLNEPAIPLTPDPTPTEVTFAEFARPIESIDAYARFSSPILVDPTVPRYAVSIHRQGNASNGNSFGRIYLVEKSVKRPEPILDRDQTVMLLDHHIASGRSLAVVGLDDGTERGGDLMLLDGLATGKLIVLGRAHVPQWNRAGFKPKIECGSLVDENRAIVRVNDDVYAWDMKSGKLNFRIQCGQTNFATSGMGKYLAVPFLGGCQLIDVERAELVGTIPSSSGSAPEVKFSPDGKRIALVGRDEVLIWNLTTAEMQSQVNLDTPAGSLFGWIDNNLILTSHALLDTGSGTIVWTYRLPSSHRNRTVRRGVVFMDSSPVLTMMSLPVPHNSVVPSVVGESRVDRGIWKDRE